MRRKHVLISLLGLGGLVVAGTSIFLNSRETVYKVAGQTCAHEVVNHYEMKAPTCTESGHIEYWVCCECHNSYSDQELKHVIPNTSVSVGQDIVEGDGRYLPPSHDYGELEVYVEPTVSAEGKARKTCKACNLVTEYKILPLVKNFKLVGNTLTWDAVPGAASYVVKTDLMLLIETKTLSQTLSANELKLVKEDLSKIYIQAVSDNDEYVTYGKTFAGEAQAGPNLQMNRNSDFNDEFNNEIRLDRIAGWNAYPYGNWSDMNNGVGGHYYITSEADGNMCLKVPAVVWWPGNTMMKKDMPASTCEAGDYELSFDIKASQASLTLNNGGKYGKFDMFMWTNANGHDGAVPVTVVGSNIVKDRANKETWTNIRARYHIDAPGTFNQMNLIYWPEGNIGEDNYILIDNIECYKVVDDVANETNVDTIDGGDLEMFNETNLSRNRWYRDSTVLIEPSAVGSSFVKDVDNTMLKVRTAPGKEIAEIDFKGNIELGKVGYYKMSMKVKSGMRSALSTISLKAWSWANNTDVVTQLVDETFFDISKVSEDGFTTIDAVFVSNGRDQVKDINLFISIDLSGDTISDANNYLLIDEYSVQALSY